MVITNTLGWVDYLIIAIMLLLCAGIGVYYKYTGGHQKTTQEYFTAAGSMNVIPVGIALMVSFVSPITQLGMTAETYMYGSQFFIYIFGYFLGTPIACWAYLPVFFKLQATSVFEYLEKRFGVAARLTASILNSAHLILYSGIVLYAPSLALEATTGLSKHLSIFLIGLVCAFYSSIGGIKAVLITDTLQGFVMIAAGFIVIFTAAPRYGGIAEIWLLAEEGGRIEFNNFSLDPTERHTCWGLLIGGMFIFLSLNGINQVQVQRFLSVRSLSAAKSALWLSWFATCLLYVAIVLCGLAIYAGYKNCDPMMEGRISSMDMIYPLYVLDNLSHLPGIAGLFVAGIFSAGLSTVSATSNSLAAVSLEDYVKPLYRKLKKQELPASKELFLGKGLAFGFGILTIALALLAQYLGGILQACVTVTGLILGPLLGIFTLGMISETATERGAISGVIVAIIFGFLIAFGQPRITVLQLPLKIDGCNETNIFNVFNSTEYEILRENTIKENSSLFFLYRISYIWYNPIGFMITLVVGLIVSNVARILLKEESQKLHPDLFFPVISDRIRRRGSSTELHKMDRKYVFAGKRDGPGTEI